MGLPEPLRPGSLSPNAVHLLRTVQQMHVQLSAMADQKARILMGASFVIFTIIIGQARSGPVTLPMLILGTGAFMSIARCWSIFIRTGRCWRARSTACSAMPIASSCSR